MDNLKAQIISYIPKTEREAADKALILQAIETFPDVLTRENVICHFTASNWIINAKHNKALMIHHNIENKWMWTGGHADGENNLLSVALREAHEETSLEHIKPLSTEIFSLEVLNAPPHIKNGKFVSAHLHLDCSFLLEADERENFKIKPDENSAIRWIDFAEILTEVKAGTMSPHYPSLIERVCNIYTTKK